MHKITTHTHTRQAPLCHLQSHTSHVTHPPPSQWYQSFVLSVAVSPETIQARRGRARWRCRVHMVPPPGTAHQPEVPDRLVRHQRSNCTEVIQRSFFSPLVPHDPSLDPNQGFSHSEAVELTTTLSRRIECKYMQVNNPRAVFLKPMAISMAF